MFDTGTDEAATAAVGGRLAAARACLAGLRMLAAGGFEAEPVDQSAEADLVDLLTSLEQVKSAAAAAQAAATEALDRAVRARHAAAGLAADAQGRGVAAQVALARQDSPHRGSRHLGLATALVREMPHTWAALRAGLLSEWRATLLVRETACLTRDDRSLVDAELCADPRALAGVGDRELGDRARKVAYRLDPHAVVARARRAEAERRVTLRPAPDVMSHLSALLPVTHGVATYAALGRAADEAKAAGDPRSRGQLMADTLVERVTGHSTSHNTAGGGPSGPIEIQLVITDRALLAGDTEPAIIPGYGPVPAEWARDLVRPADEDRTDENPRADVADVAAPAQVWLRRLYTHPGTGELVAMDSRARHFPDSLRSFLVARDQTCRTPWCDAPIRHADHAVPHAAGGRTCADNGQGLCEACNYTKEVPGWAAGPDPGRKADTNAVTVTTPTGHRYTSTPPPQPGHRGPPPARSGPASGRLEISFATVLAEYHAA